MEMEMDENEKIKICFVGEQFVGKSSFVKRFVEGKFSANYLGTLFMNLNLKRIQVGNKEYNLSLNDLSGNEKFGSNILQIIKKSTLIIFMYDITKQESFDSIPKWIEIVNKNNKNEGLQMILIGNKMDLEERKIAKETGKNFAAQNHMDFFEISCKTEENVHEAILFIIKKALNLPNNFAGEIIMDQKNLNQPKINNQKKKGCCCC